MDRIGRLFPKLTIKLRIILIFTSITVVLVGALSTVSYYFVRNIYSNQLYEQTALLTRLTGVGLNQKFLPLLPVGDRKSLANSYYREYLQNQSTVMGLNQAFIFDVDFTILAHSDSTFQLGRSQPQLSLSRSEIIGLNLAESTLSLPFKGEDGNWYLWGFYRLDEGHWLGVQESAARLARIEDLARIFWIIGLTGVFITIVSGWLLARSIAKPIDRLVKFSEDLGKGRFDAAAPAGIHGELATLTRALDRMRNDIAQKQKEKMDMLAQIAHEIRNPLGGIELLAGLIEEAAPSDSVSKDYARKILDEIAGLKVLVNDFLNYSKPVVAKPEWVDVPGLVDEIRDIFQAQSEAKGFTIFQNASANSVYFDPHHLRQILMNLVSNGLEQTEPGGSIEIEVKENEDKTTLLVKDDGPGIPQENLHSVFEPFFTTRTNGTGLGLAICRKLCRANMAEITVTNNPEKGCTFAISNEKFKQRG